MAHRLFRDDFESAGFTKWTGTSISAGETLAVQKAFVHHGGFAAEATTDGSAAIETAICYRTLAPTLSQLYARLYARVVSHDLVAVDDRFHFIRFGAAAANLAWIGWRYSGGVVKWYLLTRNGAGYSTVYATGASPVVGQWYCIEMYWLEDALAGIGRCWVDGNLIMQTPAGIDTADYGDCLYVDMGIAETFNTVVADVIFDCCVIDNTYIGPEVPLRSLSSIGGKHRNKCKMLSTRRGWGGFAGLK